MPRERHVIQSARMPYKASHPRVQGASLPLSTRVPRAGHFFFSSEEKVTKKTPPPTPHHARCARVVPCASRRPRAGANSRIPALGHARLSPAAACDARCGEGGGRSRARSRARACTALDCALASARRSALLLWLLRVPIALRRQRSEKPAGAARWIAPIPLPGQGCAVNGTRPLTWTRRAGCASGAMLWGVSLCLLSLHEQRK